MNSFSHYMIGRFLHRYIKREYGIKLGAARFLYWNIMTDFRKPYSALSHRTDGWEKSIRSFAEELVRRARTSPRLGADMTRRLGILCHFFADFFCAPHAPLYQGTYWQHIKYEWALCRYMRQCFSALCRTELAGSADHRWDSKSVTACYEALRRLYLSSAPSYENDAVFALRACIGAVVAMTRASVVQPAAAACALSGL